MAKKMVKVTRPKKRSPSGPSKRQVKFSDVTTIDTAPVAIGNSIRGAEPIVQNSANGCRVLGRDFAFEAKSTVAAATGWSLIGGLPTTPCVLATSALKAYAQLFSVFRVNRLVFHYITSSPTTQAGDILFYYERERQSPMIDCSSSSFLPLVLSDKNTVLGPQWRNHSMVVEPVKEWKNTAYGLSDDLNEESAGSVFLFSKTNSANSPGYVLIDYDITFKEMSINPRSGHLPVTRGLWNYVTTGATASAVTTGSTHYDVIQGINPDGSASVMPNGATVGDIYKMVALVTNSTVSGVNAAWTNVTTANLFAYKTDGSTTVVTNYTIDDGFTVYGVYNGSTQLTLFQNLEAARADGQNYFRYGVAATVTYNLCWLVSVVGFSNPANQALY